MARNISKDYATMDDDERRRFAQRAPGGDGPDELDFIEPRDEDNQGHSQVAQEEEKVDPEHRDGLATQLDEASHDKRVRRRSR